MRAACAALLVGLGLTALSCGDDGQSASETPTSVVALGDSVAAGEGIRYGFTYDAATRTWQGPAHPDPTWQGRYQDCHQSGRAFPNLVTDQVGAELTKLACTGATYSDGIVAPETGAAGTDYGPAQFGDLPARRDLNQRYERARPDLVLVSLGADDLDFAAVVTDCVLAAESDSTICTEANPGPAVSHALNDLLPELRRNYRELVDAIRDRGENEGSVPEILFTTYADPFPPARASIAGCPDVLTLNRDQIDYLASALGQLNDAIRRLARLQGVEVADVSGVYRDHEYCTDDPWAYGPSIRLADPTSPAPFHPTPAGQRAIAAVVTATIEG